MRYRRSSNMDKSGWLIAPGERRRSGASDFVAAVGRIPACAAGSRRTPAVRGRSIRRSGWPRNYLDFYQRMIGSAQPFGLNLLVPVSCRIYSVRETDSQENIGKGTIRGFLFQRRAALIQKIGGWNSRATNWPGMWSRLTATANLIATHLSNAPVRYSGPARPGAVRR